MQQIEIWGGPMDGRELEVADGPRAQQREGWSDSAICNALRDRSTRGTDPEDVHTHRGTYVEPILKTLSKDSKLIENRQTTQRTGAPNLWMITLEGQAVLDS